MARSGLSHGRNKRSPLDCGTNVDSHDEVIDVNHVVRTVTLCSGMSPGKTRILVGLIASMFNQFPVLNAFSGKKIPKFTPVLYLLFH